MEGRDPLKEKNMDPSQLDRAKQPFRILVVQGEKNVRREVVNVLMRNGLDSITEARDGFDAFDIIINKANKGVQTNVLVCGSRVAFVSSISLIEALSNVNRLPPTVVLCMEEVSEAKRRLTRFDDSNMLRFFPWSSELKPIVDEVLSQRKAQCFGANPPVA